jgi:hypothetical protein
MRMHNVRMSVRALCQQLCMQLCMQGTSLAQEFTELAPSANLSVIRSLVALLEEEVLCCPLPSADAAATAATDARTVVNLYADEDAESQSSSLQADAGWCLLTKGFCTTCIDAAAKSGSAHDTFAAVSALGACLQRALACLTPAAQPATQDSPAQRRLPCISAGMTARIVQLVLDNLDDRLKLVPAAATQAFGTLCAIVARQSAQATPQNGAAQPSPLADVAAVALALPAASKSRYTLLHALVPHVGASVLLALQPALVRESVAAMRHDAASAAGDLFSVLMATLHTECFSATADDCCSSSDAAASSEAMQRWRRAWVPDIVAVLTLHDEVWRARAATYTIPAICDLDAHAFALLLRILTPPDAAAAAVDARKWGLRAHVSTAAVAAVVLLLRAANKAGLVDSLEQVVTAQRSGSDAASAPSAGDDAMAARVPYALLEGAAAHKDETLRLDVLELASLSNKTTSVRMPAGNLLAAKQLQHPWSRRLAKQRPGACVLPTAQSWHHALHVRVQVPGALELRLVMAQVRLTMRESAASSHNKWLATMTKLVARVRAAALGVHQRAGQQQARAQARRSNGGVTASRHDEPAIDDVRSCQHGSCVFVLASNDALDSSSGMFRCGNVCSPKHKLGWRRAGGCLA